MRYMHGDDSQGDRILAHIRCAYCAVILLLVFYVIYVDYTVIRKDGCNLLLLLATLVLIVIASILISRMLWMNSRYSANAEGFTIKSTLKYRVISWDMICSVNYVPVLTGKHIRKNYILIAVSPQIPQAFLECPDLEYCWINCAKIISIRCTKERSKELQELCPGKFHIQNI